MTMESARRAGRLVGLLLLLQLLGLTLGFIFVMPGTTPDFLEDSARHAAQIKLGVFILLATAAVTLAISLAAYPSLRKHSEVAALAFLAVGIIWFAIQAVDNAHILSLLSLSQLHAEGAVPNAEVFAPLAAAARSTRRWMHYTELLIIDAWSLMLYALFFRFALVPRLLTGFGVAVVLVHTAAITLPVFLGYPNVLVSAYLMPVSYLALAGWLLLRGSNETVVT
jgi:Domain of unknown function (DUF4386)